MPDSDDNARDVRVFTRVSVAERDRWRAMAKRVGLTLSDWWRKLAYEAERKEGEQ